MTMRVNLVQAAALAIVLSTAAMAGAQSQLQIKPNQPPSKPMLEIPVATSPGQSTLVPAFVGDWCGTILSTPGTGSSTPENESVLRDVQSVRAEPECQTFALGSTIIVDDSLTVGKSGLALMKAGETAHVVTEYAEAVGPREITVTVVLDLAYRNKRATLALSSHLKLTDAGQVEAARTDRFQITDLNYSPLVTSSVSWSGSLHRARPGEYEAWLTKNYKIGGGDLEVPEAR
jgi:hypothetical protein